MARRRSRQRDTAKALKKHWKIGVLIYLMLALASPGRDSLQSSSTINDPLRIVPVLIFFGILLVFKAVLWLVALSKQTARNMDEIDGMSGQDFENWLDTAFARLGYSVDRTPTTGDFGADLMLSVPVWAKRNHRRLCSSEVLRLCLPSSAK